MTLCVIHTFRSLSAFLPNLFLKAAFKRGRPLFTLLTREEYFLACCIFLLLRYFNLTFLASSVVRGGHRMSPSVEGDNFLASASKSLHLCNRSCSFPTSIMPYDKVSTTFKEMRICCWSFFFFWYRYSMSIIIRKCILQQSGYNILYLP